MPTRSVPRLMMSSRREEGAGCWADADTIHRAAMTRPASIRNITSSPQAISIALWCCCAGLRPDARAVPAGEIEIVTISLYQASVGVFVPYLGNLSALLDHASAHAEARKIDPAVLLNMRLYPNMYNLTRQVGEAIRHAVIASALLAGREPHEFPETEPDIA